MYEFPHELPNNSGLGILEYLKRNLGSFNKISKFAADSLVPSLP